MLHRMPFYNGGMSRRILLTHGPHTSGAADSFAGSLSKSIDSFGCRFSISRGACSSSSLRGLAATSYAFDLAANRCPTRTNYLSFSLSKLSLSPCPLANLPLHRRSQHTVCAALAAGSPSAACAANSAETATISRSVGQRPNYSPQSSALHQADSILSRATRAHSFLPTGTSRQASTMTKHDATNVVLPRDSNQALGIAKYAIDMIQSQKYSSSISQEVYDRVQLFHTDSVLCGISALSLKTSAPTILREEALEYDNPKGACVFASSVRCFPEKAIVANCAAVREWDSNGTVFGYNANRPTHQAGEFGHNDFYPVVVAAAQVNQTIDGKKALTAMIVLDEIRGRLAEVFSLKTHKIDHVVHGAIASAAVYGALLGATEEQIEAAIGMTVAHYIPYRAIRAGKQLSDSKGASAALSTEVAIISMQRAMRGFMGPRDIFRNPEAIFCWHTKQTDGDSPFDLILSYSGSDFAVQGMHFKLGLYEHQSAGMIESLIRLLCEHPELYRQPDNIREVSIVSYEPAFSIIGDPAKRDPQTRQSADHSMVYIFAALLRKAIGMGTVPGNIEDAWMALMLTPYDYSKQAINNPMTR
eukprot:GHVT01087533.1.p1 GENE.GHVT01087533.1~~GHVT01087533.1.p1  ORF type:complete len:587 (-),score=59.76 GHVT01087533.1:1707-3467(-)